MNFFTTLQKWWATRRATQKALRGQPINWLEKELLKERYSLKEKDFQPNKLTVDEMIDLYRSRY